MKTWAIKADRIYDFVESIISAPRKDKLPQKPTIIFAN
jgi:hypothetical protein